MSVETSEVLKTSEEWIKESGYTVLSPDGWDRKNFDFSFYKEKISYSEFQKRLSLSTLYFSTKK